MFKIFTSLEEPKLWQSHFLKSLFFQCLNFSHSFSHLGPDFLACCKQCFIGFLSSTYKPTSTSDHTSVRCLSAMPASRARQPWRRTAACIGTLLGRRGMVTLPRGKPHQGSQALGTGTTRQTGRLPGTTTTPTCGDLLSCFKEKMRPVSCL